jgi:alpha-glutamyl/putrescinyl thymine pyrophosphorylase clade 1
MSIATEPRQERLPGIGLPPPADPPLIAGRRLTPTPVFDTFWRFAVSRQRLYLARLDHQPQPWTDDEILQEFRFTNVFRSADRVSQYLMSEVQYGKGRSQEPAEVVFRTLLFKFFNKVETWEEIERLVGEPTWAEFDFRHVASVLDGAAERGPIYSAAYVIPPPKLGEQRKHRNHLRLLRRMMDDRIADRLAEADGLERVYEFLAAYPSVGPFLAYQFTIDLNYSPVLGIGENDFVVAGPGARDGIEKCFGRAARGIEAEVIRWVVEHQEEEFRRLGLDFPKLFGRDLHLIDAQNLFCEVDKYARVAHPEVRGISGRTRIKQRFRPHGPVPSPFFPPSWNLTVERSAPPESRRVDHVQGALV